MQETNTLEKFRSVYLHFPFCETKCHYCDFYSLPEDHFESSKRDEVYNAILNEAVSFEKNIAPLRTLFLGGGTPSLVPIEHLQKILNVFEFDEHPEITIESNPSSIGPEKVGAWKKLGINRVSLGVQALKDERLKWLGRVHDTNSIYRALETIFDAGISRVSVDYILGVPGQTLDIIEQELNSLLNRFPLIEHVSAYLLTLKPQNPKFKLLPDEDVALSHLRKATQCLKMLGFTQYEVSNFARNGKTAIHNQNYWKGQGYLGIGPSAHSFWPNSKMRTKNWASLGKYAELITKKESVVETKEILTLEQERIEHIMLRLRRAEGLNLLEYQLKFNQDLYREKKHQIAAWTEAGLCCLNSTDEAKILVLTPEGFYLSDQIISEII